MSYRDDLGAAHARNEALAKELAEAKAALAQRSEKPTRVEPTPRSSGRLEQAARYWPLWPLCRATISDAFDFTAQIKFDGPKPRTVLGLALYGLAIPLLLLLRILLVVLLTTLLIPWTAVLSIACSAPLLPVVLLSRLKLRGMPLFSEPAWFRRPPSDGEVEAYFILVIVTFFTASMLLLANY